jgi:hypothetical protein
MAEAAYRNATTLSSPGSLIVIPEGNIYVRVIHSRRTGDLWKRRSLPLLIGDGW